MSDKFIIQPEDIAGGITGETPSGEQMLLGDDVLIFTKFIVIEQPVLNRLRANKEAGTLANELEKSQGIFYLGESEAIRAELHTNIDKMFEAIKEYRSKQLEKSSKAN